MSLNELSSFINVNKAEDSPSAATQSSWADEVFELPSAPTGATGPSMHHFQQRGQLSALERLRQMAMEDKQAASRPRNTTLPTSGPFTAYVGNLSFDTTEELLKGYFASTLGVRMVYDQTTKRFRGFSYVEFETREALSDALEKHGSVFGGRTIAVSVAESKSGHDASEWRGGEHEPVSRESRQAGEVFRSGEVVARERRDEWRGGEHEIVSRESRPGFRAGEAVAREKRSGWTKGDVVKREEKAAASEIKPNTNVPSIFQSKKKHTSAPAPPVEIIPENKERKSRFHSSSKVDPTALAPPTTSNKPDDDSQESKN